MVGYFNFVYIEFVWVKFNEIIKVEDVILEDIVIVFLFYGYFVDVFQLLFLFGVDCEIVLEIVNGCYWYIFKIFFEFVDVLFFEILCRDKDKVNYFFINEVWIVVMILIYVVMKWGEIVVFGFQYDNVIMEEVV